MNMCACVEFSEALQRQPHCCVLGAVLRLQGLLNSAHLLSPLQLVIDMLCSSESMSAERV